MNTMMNEVDAFVGEIKREQRRPIDIQWQPPRGLNAEAPGVEPGESADFEPGLPPVAL